MYEDGQDATPAERSFAPTLASLRLTCRDVLYAVRVWRAQSTYSMCKNSQCSCQLIA